MTLSKMQAWGVAVCVAVLAGSQVFAAEPLTFVEDVRSQSTRIVSGWEAEEGQIPWQLSLRMVSNIGGVSACGGTIIHTEWGLTAAHCTAQRVTMVIRAGAVSLTRPQLMFETIQYWNHPAYIDALAGVVQPNDISILKFPVAITFTDRVQPIRIQRDEDRNRDYNGIRLEASGWGRTWTNGDSPEFLQWVYLSGVTNDACSRAFGGSSIVVASTICAGGYNVTSQSTCQGDSGGPLVELEADGVYTQVGISSFVSAAGCHADFPAGFIRPGHYHDWITEVTGLSFTDWELGETTESPTTEATTETDSSESSSSESGSRESGSSESGSKESGSKESGSKESGSKESGSKESGSSESGSRESSEETETTTEDAGSAATTEPDGETTEETATEAATTEPEGETTEDATTDPEDETTEAATTEATATEPEDEDTEESNSIFSYFRLSKFF